MRRAVLMIGASLAVAGLMGCSSPSGPQSPAGVSTPSTSTAASQTPIGTLTGTTIGPPLPSQSVSVTATSKGPKPSGTPTASPVVGYGYVDPTPAAAAEFQAMLKTSQGAYTGVSVRGVTLQGARIGHLYLVRLRMGAPISPGAERALLSAVLGALTGQGTMVRSMVLNGHQVAEVTSGGQWYYAWQTSGDLAVYHGLGAKSVGDAFVGHYLLG